MRRLQQRELEHLQALLLAAGEAVVEVARGELARDLRELHRGLDGLAELLQRDLGLAARLAVRVHDHPQVLRDGDAGDRDRVLEGHEEAGAGALVRVGLGDVLAEEGDLALGDLERGVAHDDVRERALARAVGAHERVDLTLVHGEVQALEDLLLPGPDVQVLDLEVRHVVRFVVWWWGGGSGRGVDRERRADGRGHRRVYGSRGAEVHELLQRRALQRARDAALDAGPEQAGRAALVAVADVRAQHAAVLACRRRSRTSARRRPRARAPPRPS